MASLQNPVYTAAIVTAAGKRYNITNAILSLSLDERKAEISQKASVTLANVQHEGSWLSGIFSVRDRIFIYANTGDGGKEVFRGFVWEKSYKSALQKEISLLCYDNLIYFQESEESAYFSSGKSTKAICESLCKKWGVTLKYNYASITHSKLPLRGALSNIFLSDLLDAVKKQTGKKYVMRSVQDAVTIDYIGQNETIYEIAASKNAISARSSVSMSGMTTQVVILGQKDDDEREPVEATVSRNTSKYGTLQKIMNRSEDTTLSEIKEEANELLDEKAVPEEYYAVDAVDIPWIRKGDKVKVSAGNVSGSFIVLSISRDCYSKTMSLELEKASEKSSSPSDSSSGFTSYLVKVQVSALNIRTGAGTNFKKNGMITDYGVYTIVAESKGQGASKWGKLKSGAGWISLDYVKKV